MHVLAFVNEKGGCGKTTTAVNLAGALAQAGERTLVIDLDPQAHATMGLGVDASRGPTMAEVLAGTASLAEAVRPASGNIRLAPSSGELSEFEEAAGRELEPEQRLTRELRHLQTKFDYVLIDCPPRAGGVLAANALCAADTAVLVVEAGAFALQGAIKAFAIFEEAASLPGRAFDIRVIGTMFERRTRFARELLIAMHARFSEQMYDTVIRTSVRLREAAAAGSPVQVLDPRSRAAADFEALSVEVKEDARARSQARPQRIYDRQAYLAGDPASPAS